MKLVPYDLNKFDSLDLDIYMDHYGPLQDKLEKLYGVGRHLKFTGFDEIMKLGNPEGKIILDLGCGSKGSLDNYFSGRMFEPWLARGLYELKANIIGIDLGDLSTEKFKGYELDLSKENSLSLFEDNSIDIAFASLFFDSPALNRYYLEGRKTFNLLLPQLERIVKPEGYFIFDKLNSGR